MTMASVNSRLSHWFQCAGWTQRELARAVAALGQALGYNVAPDSSRVRRWLEGEHPRHPVPELLASLFTERLGRPITPEDLGLTPPTPVRDEISWNHRELAVTLQNFTRSDLMINRRGVIGASAVVATGAVLESRLAGWLDLDQWRRAVVAEPGRIGLAEIAEIEAATEMFWKWDAKRGGGLYREAVVGQLKAMSDLLDYSYSEPIARRLFRSTADLARLAGWMSHDVGLQTTAQQYFTLALHCSKEAGDIPLGGEIISRMARQMVHIGRARDALALVALAKRGGGTRMSFMELSMLTTCEAWAHAELGNTKDVDRAVILAEEQFSHGEAEETPSWLAYFDRAGLEGMAGLAYRTLAEHHPAVASHAEPHLINALDLRKRDAYPRSNTFDIISLAGIRIIQGEHNEAAKLARRAITTAGQISSTRTFDRIKNLRNRAHQQSHRSTEAQRLVTTLEHAMPEGA